LAMYTGSSAIEHSVWRASVGEWRKVPEASGYKAPIPLAAFSDPTPDGTPWATAPWARRGPNGPAIQAGAV